MREQLERGAECSCKKTAGTCRKLLKQESWPWTFVWVEGIEPTNNDAERVLRHAVLWRKSSGGTDSEAGSRFVADAECRGHLSAAESQRLGVTDRLLSRTARRLRCPFSAARTGRTGRRLIGEFPFGTALLRGPIRAKSRHRRGISGPIRKKFGISSGGARKPLQRRASQLNSRACRLGRLSGVGRALNGCCLPTRNRFRFAAEQYRICRKEDL